MIIHAGQLNKRVFIERPSPTTSASGEQSLGWTNFENRTTARAARIVPLSGRELEHARQVSAVATHRIEIRRLPGVKPSMRVSWRPKKRRFNIEAVVNVDEADVGMHLFCSEVPWREDIEE